jgi:peptide/nickel transport system permease protein
MFVGDASTGVYALDLSHNGSVLWSDVLPAASVQLDVADGVLFAGTTAGQLLALSESNGTSLWQVQLNGSVVQAVGVAGSNVLAAASDGYLYAIAVASGTLGWRTYVGVPAGGPSVEGGRIFVATSSGTLEALRTSGGIVWTSSVGASIATAPAASGADVLVADLSGNVSDFSTSNGTLQWRWNAPAAGVDDSVHATPAVDPQRVYVAFDSGSVRAFNRSNGGLLWATAGAYSGFPNPSAVAVTPTGVYAVLNGILLLVDLNPSSGRTLFESYLGSFVFTSPALVSGSLFFGAESGCVAAVGSQGAFARWPVSGTVVNATDRAPLAGAFVSVGGSSTASGSDGTFSFSLTNGTYVITTFLPGYASSNTSVVVRGPTRGIEVRLSPLVVYRVSGILRDQDSGRGLAGIAVALAGPNEFARNTTTGPGGFFLLAAPNGTSVLTTPAGPGYDRSSLAIVVAGGPVFGAVLLAPPTAVPTDARTPSWLYVALPAAALLAAGWYAGTRELGHRRIARGLPPAVLSRFSFYITTRVLLLFAQVAFLLGLLYAVTTLLPAALSGQALCDTIGTGCAGCGWDDLLCTAPLVVHGFVGELVDLFTFQWGSDTLGQLTEPTTTFLGWWLPNSVQLGVVAMALAVGIAYPAALVAGWRQGGVFDPAARAASLVGLLTPSFLLVILLVGAVVPAYVHAYGELPYGLLPGPAWFVTHGGQPSWIGVGYQTNPTGFPLVDGVVHRDWAFEQIVLLKTLWQAAIIALVYVAVFLRHSWAVAATTSREPQIGAARARAIPERTLLWRYTGRRVLPFFVLTFALTFPAFLLTQSLVESLFFDQGVGYLFFSDLTSIATHPKVVEQGGVLQVALFLLILLTLTVNLVADVVARYLDPRLRSGAG